MRKLIFILAFLAFPVLGLATACDVPNLACYVRSAAGGSNDGSDWTNAYTALPANMTRGYTYFVAAGSYGPHDFADADSGTALITIQAPTVAVHGTAVGWSNAYVGQVVFACAGSCSYIIQFSTDYYVFNGIYRSTATGNPETDWVLESGYGFKLDNSGTHTHQCSGISEGTGDIQAGLGYTAGSPPDYVHDITIRYVDIAGGNPTSDAGCIAQAVDWEGGSYNMTFDHGFIHQEAVPFFIKGSHNHQNGGGFVFGSGDSNTVQYTYVLQNYSSPGYHSEACSCGEGLTNFTWRYNYSDQIGGMDSNGSTAHIASAGGSSPTTNGPDGPWFIYGNVFTTTATSRCLTGDGVVLLFYSVWTDNAYFLNNTTYNLGANYCTGAYETGFVVGAGYSTTLQWLYSENNLFYNADGMTIVPTGTTSQDSATLTGTTWSYNGYFNTPTAGGADTDANKQVSASNPFSAGGACCTLAADTTNGTNTHTLVPGNDLDMNGVSRGANGTWDRGALQLPASPPVYAPINLRAVPH